MGDSLRDHPGRLVRGPVVVADGQRRALREFDPETVDVGQRLGAQVGAVQIRHDAAVTVAHDRHRSRAQGSIREHWPTQDPPLDAVTKGHRLRERSIRRVAASSRPAPDGKRPDATHRQRARPGRAVPHRMAGLPDSTGNRKACTAEPQGSTASRRRSTPIRTGRNRNVRRTTPPQRSRRHTERRAHM
jgi:hypothetical protein